MATLTSQLVELDDATRLEVFRGGTGSPVVCCSHPHEPSIIESERRSYCCWRTAATVSPK